MAAPASSPDTVVYTQRKTCRVCDAKTLVSVLNLGDQELPRFLDSENEPVPKAPLHLVRCATCGLLQLEHSVDPDLVFRQYWYRSSINQTMRKALKDLVATATQIKERGVWLDIGANDGCLLDQTPDIFRRIACEPAITFHDQLREHAEVVIPTYFSREALTNAGEDKCDVITSAAMFYDLDDPNSFVADIAKSLAKGGVWVNQLNDSPTMLKRNAFDSIVHEHLCYYDLPTLKDLYERHGLEINHVSYNEVNGGSIRITASKKRTLSRLSDTWFVGNSQQEVESFALRVKRWRRQMREIIDSDLMRYRPLWGYGASTKLGVMLGYLERNEVFIGIADRNAAKWGRKFGGTGIPIVNEVQFRAAKPGYVLVGPWAFRNEFIERERTIMDAGATLIFPLPNIEFVI